jgi:hypothetical protein
MEESIERFMRFLTIAVTGSTANDVASGRYGFAVSMQGIADMLLRGGCAGPSQTHDGTLGYGRESGREEKGNGSSFSHGLLLLTGCREISIVPNVPQTYYCPPG